MTIRWEAAGATHVGRVRKGNEDAFLLDEGRGIFVIADGMGGHAAGEVASSLAVRMMAERLAQAIDSGHPAAELPEVIEQAFHAIQEEFSRCCSDDPRKAGMGTTLIACAITRVGACRVGHLGDSRAYRLRDGRLDALTIDHTWVQREIDAGRLAATAAEAHPFSHMLSRVLSADMPSDPDLLAPDLQPDDLLLLTTDGLHGLVPDAEILRICSQDSQHLPLPALLDLLIERANTRGGRDNITAIAVRILPNG